MLLGDLTQGLARLGRTHIGSRRVESHKAEMWPLVLQSLAFAPTGLVLPPAVTRSHRSPFAAAVVMEASTFEAPAAVLHRQPSPVLQPREVIATMMSALHRSSWDEPRPYFGFEVALRFLAPTHQVKGATPREFQRYLRQPHKEALLNWAEYKWEGELTIINNKEAFQQVSIRSGSDADWTSVRWLLVRVDAGDTPHTCWMVDGVLVEEPDSYSGDDWTTGVASGTIMEPLTESEMRAAFDRIDADRSGAISKDELKSAVSALGIARSESELDDLMTIVDDDASGEIEFDEFQSLLATINSECHLGKFASDLAKSVREAETASVVVERVMRALRNPDEPYPLHGAEVAIRYCSPRNRASSVSPSTFASYLEEPWYEILLEWDEIEIEDDLEAECDLEKNSCSVDVLVKRSEDDSWTIVNWTLSRHNGRWLTDSLSIN